MDDPNGKWECTSQWVTESSKIIGDCISSRFSMFVTATKQIANYSLSYRRFNPRLLRNSWFWRLNFFSFLPWFLDVWPVWALVDDWCWMDIFFCLYSFLNCKLFPFSLEDLKMQSDGDFFTSKIDQVSVLVDNFQLNVINTAHTYRLIDNFWRNFYNFVNLNFSLSWHLTYWVYAV